MEHEYRNTVVGTVIHGQKLGKKYDLPPTMNIEAESISPALEEGIYAVRVRRLNSEDAANEPLYRGVLHYGPRPAVNAEKSFEVHLFEFDEEWYGEKVEVKIGSYIRPVMNFNSIEELKKQIEMDIQAAKLTF